MTERRALYSFCGGALFGMAILALILGLTACATPKTVNRAPAINPSALQTRPLPLIEADKTCSTHGGVGLVRRVEFVCNDGMDGLLEIRE